MMTRVPEKWKGLLAILALAIAVFFTPIILSQHLIGPDFVVPPTGSIPLPDPDLEGNLSLTAALHYPAISDNLRSYSMNVSELSQLMWSMQGITNDWGNRAAPSAGGTYPLEIFVHVSESHSIPLGLHKYLPNGHHILPISSSTTFGSSDAFFGNERASIENVSVVIIIAANYSRTTDRYGDRGVQYVHLETGHVLQNCLLELASLGLATLPVSSFSNEALQSYLHTSLVPLLVLPIGFQETSSSSEEYSQFSEISVEHAISLRRSQREYQTGNISGIALESLVGNLSLVDVLCDSVHLDVKIVTGNVTGFENGLYDYDFSNDEMSLIEIGDLREDLYIAGLNQPWIRDAQAGIVLSCSQFWAESQSSPELRWRELLHCMGMLAQTVYLKCTGMSLGTVSVGAFYDYLVIDVVEIPTGFLPVYIMPIGSV